MINVFYTVHILEQGRKRYVKENNREKEREREKGRRRYIEREGEIREIEREREGERERCKGYRERE